VRAFVTNARSWRRLLTSSYSAPIAERSIVMTVSVCVSVCVFVCPRAYLWKYTHMLPMAMAQSSSGVSLPYAMFFRFMDDVILEHKPKQLNVASPADRNTVHMQPRT